VKLVNRGLSGDRLLNGSGGGTGGGERLSERNSEKKL